MELIKEIGAFAGLVAFLGLALLALLSFAQGRDIRRLREWAGSAPERDGERKEQTSAAAAERAEEMRKLTEAREAERQAADLREERRKRREAGLPEMTRRERIRERLPGFRLGDRRVLAAIAIAVLVAVAGGAAYAVLGGSEDEGAGATPRARQARQTRVVKPAEIEVTVLNGTATPGLAATYGDKVESKGFQLGAVTNSPSSFEDSVVMYKRGNAPEARRVSKALNIPEKAVMSSEVAAVAAGAPVSVVVGEDNASAAR